MEFDGYPAQNLLRRLRFLPQTELHLTQQFSCQDGKSRV